MLNSPHAERFEAVLIGLVAATASGTGRASENAVGSIPAAAKVAVYNIDEQKVAAEFKNGVLNVHLPKAEHATPTAIDLKVS